MCVNVLLIILSQLCISTLEFSVEVKDDLAEGNLCPLENGEQGVCRKLPDCPSRMKEVHEGRRNSESSGRCGFQDFVEIVCCPIDFDDKIGRRAAETACQQYDNEITVNEVKPDDLTFHIFGGVQAQSGEFPYMVALGYENDNTDEDAPPIRYGCGGSLISTQHVLTAAHCVNNINERVPIEVRLGNENINSTATSVQRIPISDIISHPLYKRSTNYNDVAILKLKTNVQLSTTVKPICLQTRSLHTMNITSRTPLVVIGWGDTSFDSEGSSTLMRTPSLSLVDRKECAKFYTGFNKLPQGIDDTMICAIDKNSSRRADACQGDSGGPLLMLTETGDSVIGITAFGQSCGSSTPGVYMAVHSFLDWIEEHVWPSNDREREKEPETISVHFTIEVRDPEE
ncbi:serine protease snake-like [Hylaeus anthracinus]|uniref:serine protease snake-like n=1 Tax=Hylaeus anthracinus TaxID=313031 RepID=UPI0023B8FECD|nr:serine protease snake-like [Hylaeus anthracinus]XP_054005860.1 serine protease snake-like [Hylaeus anthracinus]